MKTIKGALFQMHFPIRNVKDCQRTPAYPETGKDFRAFNFRNPYRQNGTQLEDSELEGHYFRLVEETGDTVGLYLCQEYNEMEAGEKVCSGNIYALDEAGFLLVSGRFGYFFSMDSLEGINEVSYRAAMGKATMNQIVEFTFDKGQIFQVRFKPWKVKDCQRNPAFPTVGKNFSLSGFRNPYYGQNRVLTDKEMAEHYFKLVEETVDTVGLYLCREDGKIVKEDEFSATRICGGSLYGLDQKGFMLDTGANRGYFFFCEEESVEYTAKVGKATADQILAYRL